jgi:hypothetical protein
MQATLRSDECLRPTLKKRRGLGLKVGKGDAADTRFASTSVGIRLIPLKNSPGNSAAMT